MTQPTATPMIVRIRAALDGKPAEQLIALRAVVGTLEAELRAQRAEIDDVLGDAPAPKPRRAPRTTRFASNRTPEQERLHVLGSLGECDSATVEEIAKLAGLTRKSTLGHLEALLASEERVTRARAGKGWRWSLVKGSEAAQ